MCHTQVSCVRVNVPLCEAYRVVFTSLTAPLSYLLRSDPVANAARNYPLLHGQRATALHQVRELPPHTAQLGLLGVIRYVARGRRLGVV